MHCLLRWLRDKEDELHGLVSGFLAGWSMLWFKSQTIALYAAFKLAEVILLTEKVVTDNCVSEIKLHAFVLTNTSF